MKMKKGQGAMLDDILMAVFILIIIVMAVFFVFGLQLGSSKTEQTIERVKETIFTTDYFMQSPLLSKEPRVLDDSKLANFISDKGCEDLKKIIGKQKMCIQVEKILLSGEKEYQCIEGQFSECTKWEMCSNDCVDLEGKSTIIESPVNIHRATKNKNELGLIRVKLPVE